MNLKKTITLILLLLCINLCFGQDTIRYGLSRRNMVTVINDTQIITETFPTLITSESLTQVNDSNGNILLISGGTFINDDKGTRLNQNSWHWLGANRAAEKGCVMFHLQDSHYFIATTPYFKEDTGWEYSIFTYTKQTGVLNFLQFRVKMNEFKVNEPISAVQSPDGNFWIILCGAENNELYSFKLLPNGHLFKKPVISHISLDFSFFPDRQNYITFNNHLNKCAISNYIQSKVALFDFDLVTGRFTNENMFDPDVELLSDFIVGNKEDSFLTIFYNQKILIHFNLNSQKKDTILEFSNGNRGPFSLNDSIYIFTGLKKVYVYNHNQQKIVDTLSLSQFFEGGVPNLLHRKPYDLQLNFLNEQTLHIQTDTGILFSKMGLDTVINLGKKKVSYQSSSVSYSFSLKSGLAISPNDSINCFNPADKNIFITIKNYHTIELEDGTVLQSDSLNIDSFLGKKIFYMDSNGFAGIITLTNTYQAKVNQDWRYLSMNKDIVLDTINYTYQWYRNNTPIVQNVLSFRADSAGNYYYRIASKQDSCLLQSEILAHQINNNNQLDDKPYRVYPNPINSFININSSNNEPIAYTLYNALGKRIVTGSTNNQAAIPMQQLTAGNYILILQTNQNQVYYEKIIKLD